MRTVVLPAVRQFATQTAPDAARDLSHAFGYWLRQKRLDREAARAAGRAPWYAPRFWRLRRGRVEVVVVDGTVRVRSTARPKRELEFSVYAWDEFLDEVKEDKHDVHA